MYKAQIYSIYFPEHEEYGKKYFKKPWQGGVKVKKRERNNDLEE